MLKEPHILIKDDDSNWFLIPQRLRLEFEDLRDDEDWKGLTEKFAANMIDNPRNLVILDWRTKE